LAPLFSDKHPAGKIISRWMVALSPESASRRRAALAMPGRSVCFIRVTWNAPESKRWIGGRGPPMPLWAGAPMASWD